MKYLAIIFTILFTAGCGNAQEKEARKKETEEEKSIHAGDTVKQKSIIYKLIDPSQRVSQNRLNRHNFEDSMRTLYDSIGLAEYDLDYDVFRHGMIGYYHMLQTGMIGSKDIISFIDFTKSSCDKRFYTVDLEEKEVLFNTLVSHGQGTGGDMARKFSNIPQSYQSSLGFYVTAETYIGSKGYSLRLEGAEKGVNDKMRERAVVMHDAHYVSENWVRRYGRIGRSQGCPALPKEISREVIDTIKEGSPVFAYFNDNVYLRSSELLNLDKLLERFDEE